MTGKYADGRRLGFGLVAALGIVGMTASSATAIERWAYDNSDCKQRVALAADGAISADEAKELVTLYLSELGYARAGTSRFSALVTDVKPEGDKWRVEFRYGERLRGAWKIS